MNSRTVLENEEYLKDAVLNGLEGEAIGSTLEDVVNKAEEMGKAPEQLKETIGTIVEIKSSVKENVDENYSSEIVRNNSSKIKSAIEEGIKSEEIAQTLINSTEKTNNKNDRKHLKFIVKLVSKMKKKELTINMKKEHQMGGIQKVKK